MKKPLIVFFMCLAALCQALVSDAGTLPQGGSSAPAILSHLYSHEPKAAASYSASNAYDFSWIPSLLGQNKQPSFDVPVVINKEVEHFIKYFQNRGKKHFHVWLERSQMYMPMITEMLASEGLPEDLVYLALIESGFSPYARSRAKAVGIWQFMRWTGKKYGLTINWWVDERRDPEKATVAASKFLKHLNNRFDSWYLAAASYNGGEGRVNGAIKKFKTRDFWEIASHKNKRKGLRRETRNYVPKFIAAMIIAKDPEKYGFTNINYMEPLVYDKVKVYHPTDIRVIAKASGTTPGQIKKLNPELLRWFTPPGRSSYEVKIPQGRSEMFKERMSLIPKPKRLNFHTHRVRRGDTLWKISRRYGTPIKPIMHLNNIKNARHLRPGSKIVIPVRARKARANKKKLASLKLVEETVPRSGAYTVRPGDTLWDISQRFGIGVSDIIKLNDMPNGHNIMPGQKIYLKEVRLHKSKNKTSLN